MRYLLLINPDPTIRGALSDDETGRMMADYMTFSQAIVTSGEMVSGDRLHGPEAATTVRVRGGKITNTDGPFAETKEVLGGYYVVDCKDLDRALELAAQIPDARTGSVEVRPVWEM